MKTKQSMKFTQPCFIRKNTKELIEYLENLGYNTINAGGCTLDAHNYDGKGSHRKINEGTLIITSTPDYYGVCYEMDRGVSLDRIDCGTNEPLFKAIAALSDELIEGQYLKADDDFMVRWGDEVGNDMSRKIGADEVFVADSVFIHSEASSDIPWHVMTVRELIEHFRSN